MQYNGRPITGNLASHGQDLSSSEFELACEKPNSTSTLHEAQFQWVLAALLPAHSTSLCISAVHKEVVANCAQKGHCTICNLHFMDMASTVVSLGITLRIIKGTRKDSCSEARIASLKR